MEKPYVFQDENATYCFIVGTTDAVAAEKALREQEEEWYGPEKDRTSELEKPVEPWRTTKP